MIYFFCTYWLRNKSITIFIKSMFCIFLQLTTYWLPFLRHTLGEEHRTPVILVGNKVDMTDVQTLEVSEASCLIYLKKSLPHHK